MELSPEYAQAMNDQVTLEVEASIVYRQLSIEMDVLDLPGIAAWFRSQAEEEIVHANKFIDHMTDRGAHPKIGTINAPSVTVSNALDAFKASLNHEKKVSEAIRNLYREAQKQGDIDSIPMLNWFIEEQVEEEASVGAIIAKLELIGDNGPGLIDLDQSLGARRPAEDAV